MKKIILFILIISSTTVLFSQIPIGTFKDHLPYRSFYAVAIADDYVYCATKHSLMLIDKKDNSTSTWSKVEGLSDVGIKTIYYSKENNTLIVAYSNSNIDFIKDDKLRNLSDIKEKQITGSKSINEIKSYDNIAYLSCAFGVVLIDLKSYYILDTWFTSLNQENYNANNTILFQDTFYLTTNKGVFKIDKENLFISNFGAWEKIEELGNMSFTIAQVFNDDLFLKGTTETGENIVYTNHNGEWKPGAPFAQFNYTAADASTNELCLINKDTIQIYDTDFNITFDGKYAPYGHWSAGRMVQFDKNNNIWIADEHLGMVCFDRQTLKPNLHTANGPYSGDAGNISISNDVVAIAPSSFNGWNPIFSYPSCSFQTNYTWTFNDDFLEYPNAHDFNNIIINPHNNRESYVASWGSGLYKLIDGKIVAHYNDSNSPLEPRDTNNRLVLVSGLAFDQYQNLWITNSMTDNMLKVLKKDGTWNSYSLRMYVPNSNGPVAHQLLIDSRNYKWITIPRTNQLIVYNDNYTPDNDADDKVVSINLNSYADINTSNILCIAEDKNGKIWIGTEKGIKVVQNPGMIFDGRNYAQNLYITQDNFTHYLFEFETVTCIAVDDANRKWIGTNKAGIFLMSEDGSEELLNFTVDNSPLYSNHINSIAIHPINGEVFIATQAGLISYRGTATQGKEDYDEAFVFPNPVRRDYRGTIAVTGLMGNSFCKIVDAAGHLVWQGYANGGTLTWDGKDYKGRRPATGVYFVMASNETGKIKKVAKILFVN